MTIHIISTINGQENEGMRNIATHYSREWKKVCNVKNSGLKDLWSVVKNTISSDVTVVFARAGKATYYLLRFLCVMCKNVWLVCVQKPDQTYRTLCEKKAPGNHYFFLIPEDQQGVKIKSGRKSNPLQVGIDDKKFAPTSLRSAAVIKQQYGFSPEKILVAHVGHCSAGRGLDQFAALTDSNIEKLVVASGMFEDEQTKEMLGKAGVKILSGYLPNVEEIYQMADVYLFPTKSAEHVISIPLSVMEALSCGTPVAACTDLSGIKQICAADQAMRIIADDADLCGEIRKLCVEKSTKTLLREPRSWKAVASEALSVIKENMI